jgi:hypothetical protein
LPDFAKKVRKHCAGDLHPGETVEAATFGQPAGSFGRNVAFGVGGVVGSVAADRVARRRREEHEGATESGTAAGFPRADSVLALTPLRLLVFSHRKMSGNPGDLVAEYPLDRIEAITQDKRKMHRSLQIRFADGSLVDLDVVKMAKPDAFVAAFERLGS